MLVLFWGLARIGLNWVYWELWCHVYLHLLCLGQGVIALEGGCRVVWSLGFLGGLGGDWIRRGVGKGFVHLRLGVWLVCGVCSGLDWFELSIMVLCVCVG